MNCKFIKLSTGDDLIVSTQDSLDDLDSKKYIEISRPVVIHSIRVPHDGGVIESYIMKPWVKMVKDEVIRIPVSSIIITGNVIEVAEKHYEEFLAADTAPVEGIEDMEDEIIDDILDNLFDNTESSEDDNDSWTNGEGRTLH